MKLSFIIAVFTATLAMAAPGAVSAPSFSYFNGKPDSSGGYTREEIDIYGNTFEIACNRCPCDRDNHCVCVPSGCCLPYCSYCPGSMAVPAMIPAPPPESISLKRDNRKVARDDASTNTACVECPCDGWTGACKCVINGCCGHDCHW